VTTEVNSNNDPAIRNIPILRQATVTSFPVTPEGKSFRFMVRVFNKEGSADSVYTSIVLAGVPDTPASAPTLEADETDDTQISVTLPFIPDSNNGNSPIVSYSLEMDDGQGGDFEAIGGLISNSMQTTYMVAEGIVRGMTYRFRYRVLNGAGWSDYSPIQYAQAATTPSAPPAPSLQSASSTTIVLDFSESLDNGGSPIILYELYMDAGSIGSAYSKVTSYAGSTLTHTLTAGSDSLVSGTTYGFKFRAGNAIGYSEYSSEVRFAAASLPAQPAAPTKSLTASSKTSITVQWAESAATEVPILGYKLFMSASTGSFSLVYDGSRNPVLRQYTVPNTTTGGQYQFKVVAVNYNGVSPESPELVTYSCVQPTQPAAPARKSGTATTVTLGWAQPSDNGGCPISGYKLYRDDGAGSSVNIEIDAATVNDKPYLQEHTVTLAGPDTGKTFRY